MTSRAAESMPAQSPELVVMPTETESWAHRINWRLVVAYFIYYLWQLATKPIVCLVSCTVIAEGYRVILPELAVKVWRLKLPWFEALEEYEWACTLDLAILLSIVMFLAVYVLWSKAILLWLNDDEEYEPHRWNSENHRRFIIYLSASLLFFDAVLFYLGVAEMSWGSSFSLTAVIATGAYVGVMIFISYVSLELRLKIHDIKKEGER